MSADAGLLLESIEGLTPSTLVTLHHTGYTDALSGTKRTTTVTTGWVNENNVTSGYVALRTTSAKAATAVAIPYSAITAAQGTGGWRKLG